MAHSPKSAGDGIAPGSAHQTGNTPPAGVAVLAPLPLRKGDLALADLIDLYMAHYAGRDVARPQRLAFWRAHIGAATLDTVSDDHIDVVLRTLEQQPCRYFAGKDAEGKPIFKAKKKPTSGATVNRYLACIGAVFTWAIKRRIAPKGYTHPCRAVERRPESAGKTRFLDAAELARLLAACKAASWDRMYLLFLLAVTTGARKGELLGLRWRDIDLERAEATIARTKNSDPKVLPLVPAAVAELARHKPKEKADLLLFASRRRPDQAFAFEELWGDVLKAAKVRHFRFHDCRHTCASMLAQNGATLLEIADVLGHRQLSMTKRYSHLTTGHKAALINRVLGEIS